MLRFERFNTFYIFNLHLDARWGRHNGAHLEDYSRAELKAIRGSRPEYLIMPATFGMWVVVMLFYVFCTKTGCDFINWLQNHCLPRNRRFSNLQGGIRVGILQPVGAIYVMHWQPLSCSGHLWRLWPVMAFSMRYGLNL